MTGETVTLAVLAQLRATKFNFTNELELQDGIAKLFPLAEREWRLGESDRIDFLFDGVGIEVKTAGANSDVIRQLHRYAQHPTVYSLILVTNRARHKCMPRDINGKAVRVVMVGGAF